MESLARSAMLTSAEHTKLKDLVLEVHSDCPGQIQSRYLSRILAHSDRLVKRISDSYWQESTPVHLTNLPTFSDIEHTKILLLALGETIGSCVGYSEYNQSYITDIRPTVLSKELSSGTDLLAMHNDLAFASDVCRPAALVLTPHIAEGNVPKTLIASAREVASLLSTEEKAILEKEFYEIRSGGSLRWPCEQVRRISVLDIDTNGMMRIRLNFSSIQPIATLSTSTKAEAQNALNRVAEYALAVGRKEGIALRKGEALLIPNDHCLHGRDTFEDPNANRLLLRSYVITKETVRLQNGNTMLSLRF